MFNNKIYWHLILYGLFLLLSTRTLVAQDVLSISYEFKNKRLSTALKKLEKDYQLIFAYDEKLIAPLVVRSAKVEAVRLEEALKTILSPLQLGFEVLNNKFVLIKKLNPSEQESTLPEEQTVPTICGSILDSTTQQVLAFSNVLLQSSGRGVHANADGEFTLKGPFTKLDSIDISYIGYTTQSISVEQLLNKNCANIFLIPEEITIESVLIQERAIELLRTVGSGTGLQFDTDQMGTLPGWGDNDVLRMVQLIPGIHSTNESASELHIRGGTPDQNLILWEGIPIYHTGHFFGMFSAVNPFAADNIEVYRGGFGAKYGERVSGLINISGDLEALDSLEVQAGLNLINGNLSVKAPIRKGKSAILFALRRSYTDLIQSDTYKNLFNQLSGAGKIQNFENQAREASIDLQSSSVFYFSDLNFKWLSTPKRNSKASLSFYSGKDDLDYTAIVDLPQFSFYLNSYDRIRLNNWGLSGFWEEQVSKRLLSTFRLSYTDFGYWYNVGATENPTNLYEAEGEQYNRVRDLSLQLDNTWRIDASQKLDFGYHFTDKSVLLDLSYREDSSINNVVNERFEGNLHTYYLDYRYTEAEQFFIDFGLRFNKFGKQQASFWEPRLTIDISVTDDLHLKLGLGQHLQFVRRMVQYNELGFGEELWVMANEKFNIPPVISTQFSAGFWLDRKGFLIDAEVYRKRVLNLTSLNLKFNTRSDNPFSIGEANIQGLDILIKKKWKRYSTWFSYSLGNVSYEFPRIDDGFAFPATHDQLHTINWTHIFKLGNWEYALSWNYGSGRPFTQAVGYSSNNAGNPQLDYGYINAERLPAYHRLDFSMHYKWYNKGASGKIGLSLFNLYDQQNIFDKKFFLAAPNQMNELPRILEVDRTLLRFTPNLFFEIAW